MTEQLASKIDFFAIKFREGVVHEAHAFEAGARPFNGEPRRVGADRQVPLLPRLRPLVLFPL